MTLVDSVMNELRCKAAVAKFLAENNAEGCTAWVFIDRACREYGVLPHSLGYHLRDGHPFDCVGASCCACNREVK